MSLLFVGYDFEKINWKEIKKIGKKEAEEVDEKDDISLHYKGIFSIADSAITSSGGSKTLLTGFRKVYDMKAKLYKPDFAPDGSFRSYSYIYTELPFIVGFAGSTLVAQHILNSISGHLENLEISFTEKEKLEKDDIAVLGMRNRFEERAKTVFIEEYIKDNPHVTKVLIEFMGKCITDVHEDGSFEINKPIVYKSLENGRIKKVNI